LADGQSGHIEPDRILDGRRVFGDLICAERQIDIDSLIVGFELCQGVQRDVGI
jgi:hypothetical protein